MHRFLFLFLCFQLHGQVTLPYGFREIDSLIETNPDWKHFEPADATAIRDRFLRYIFSSQSDKIYFFGADERDDSSTFTEFARYHGQHTYVMDVDGNATPDILYDGRTSPGFESGSALIFLSDPEITEFSLLANYSGTFLGAAQQSGGSELLIWTYPCCAEFMHRLTKLKVGRTTSGDWAELDAKEENSLGFILFDPRDFDHTDLSVPEAGWISENETRLLVAPDKNDLTMEHSSDQYSDGFTPVIALLPEKTTVSIVTKYTDDTGFTWCFVILENREELKENIFRDALFTEPQQIAGWVAAEKVMLR